MQNESNAWTMEEVEIWLTKYAKCKVLVETVPERKLNMKCKVQVNLLRGEVSYGVFLRDMEGAPVSAQVTSRKHTPLAAVQERKGREMFVGVLQV